MLVTEVDYVAGTSPKRYGPPVRVRPVRDFGGSESLRERNFAESPVGQRRMVFRRRAGRKNGETYIQLLGSWYKVTGVQPMAGSRTLDVVTMTPEDVKLDIVEPITVNGEPVTINGEQVTV